MNSRDIFSVRGPKPQALAQIHSTMDLLPQQQFFTFALNPRKNQTMKSSITSNLRLPLYALYAFLIAIAVLWVMPRNASAQMYVAQLFSNRLDLGFVGENNATTGAIININFITPLNRPLDLAVSGNNLFVLTFNGTVGKYDATTGGAINPAFITRLADPFGLAVEGNSLFVTDSVTPDGAVGKYDATTGAVISARFISGLPSPTGMALRGNELFVATAGGQDAAGFVGKYDATTGAVISASLVTDLHFPLALALLGNALFVAEDATPTGGPRVGKYDATTGEVINAAFIKARGSVALLAIAIKSAK
jgi:hypothetical protein